MPKQTKTKMEAALAIRNKEKRTAAILERLDEIIDFCDDRLLELYFQCYM